MGVPAYEALQANSSGKVAREIKPAWDVRTGVRDARDGRGEHSVLRNWGSQKTENHYLNRFIGFFIH